MKWSDIGRYPIFGKDRLQGKGGEGQCFPKCWFHQRVATDWNEEERDIFIQNISKYGMGCEHLHYETSQKMMMYCTINGHSRLERIRSGDKCVKWRQVGEMRPISDCLARRREKSTDSFRSLLPIYKYHDKKWPIDKWSHLKTMHNIIWIFPRLTIKQRKISI